MRRALALLLLLAGCARYPAGAEPAVLLTAYLGRGVERSAKCRFDEVSLAAWEEFRARVVAPRFPGHTVVQGSGHWRGTAERSLVLSALQPRAEREAAWARMREVAEAYNEAFCQHSVLLQETPAAMMSVERPADAPLTPR